MRAALDANDDQRVHDCRKTVVQMYEELEARHQRYVSFIDESSEDVARENEAWIKAVTDEHRRVLRDVDTFLSTQTDYASPAFQSAKSVSSAKSRTSQRSSTSTIRSKLREAERAEKEAALRLKQQREEAQLQEEEERKLEEARRLQREIERRRSDRATAQAHEQLQLTRTLLRSQLEEEEGAEADNTEMIPHEVAIDKSMVDSSRRDDSCGVANAPFQPSVLTFVPQPRFQTSTVPTLPSAGATDVAPAERRENTNAASRVSQPATNPSTARTLPPRDPDRSPALVSRCSALLPDERAAGQEVSTSSTQVPVHSTLNQAKVPTTSPDGWIQSIRAGNKEQHGNGSTLRPPRPALMSFSGEPRDWPQFIQAFKVQVHNACGSDWERQLHLRSCLPENIANSLGPYLQNPGLYPQCLSELQRRYGSPHAIVCSCTTSLSALETFKEQDTKGLMKFSATLRAVVATLS